MLSPIYFATLDILSGLHTVNGFSSFRTKQISRFGSSYLNPMTGHTLTQWQGACECITQWSREINWIFPPRYLVARVIQHMYEVKGKNGTSSLIVILWISVPWWPYKWTPAPTVDSRLAWPPTEWWHVYSSSGWKLLIWFGDTSQWSLGIKIYFRKPPFLRNGSGTKPFL